MVILGTSLQENQQIMKSISKEDFKVLTGHKIEETKIVNLANDDQYKSQVDNRIIPSGTCNVTSMGMGGEIVGLKEYPNLNIPSKYNQIEDRISYFIMNDPELKKLYESLQYVWYRENNYQPMEIHDILSKGVNKFYTGSSKNTITKFSTSNDYKDLIYDIILKLKPFISSGKFWKYAHVVCFNGIMTTQTDIFQAKQESDIDIDLISGFIYDDPFGKMSTQYKDKNGNNQIMTIADFSDIINHKGRLDKKWSHRFI